MPQKMLKQSGATPMDGQTDGELSRLLELVRFRAAQLVGSSEAIELHAQQLLHLGESRGRTEVVHGWVESSLFTPKERRAFALCEALVLADQVEMAESLLPMARQELTEEEMLGIVIAVSTVIDWSQMRGAENGGAETAGKLSVAA